MLRPTFMGFDIAKRGLQVSQKGLDVTGQNMINWDSQGYTRQRIDQVAIAGNYSSSRYGTSSSRIAFAGQGVQISGVAQIRDSYLDKRFRDEYTEEGYLGTAMNILYDLESAISEYDPLSDSSIGDRLTSLIGQLQAFSTNPESQSYANVIRTEFNSLCQTLQMISGQIDKIFEQQVFNLGVSVGEVNDKLQAIANLNHAIAKESTLNINNTRYGNNELLDQRNMLLDELSQYGDISYTENSDGTITLKMGGMVVVDGDRWEKLETYENNSGTVGIRWQSTGKDANLSGGILKGFTDFINGRGPNVQNPGETPYKGILYYRDKLDTLAQTLVDVVNNVVPDYDANGNLVGNKTLLGAMVQDANGNYVVVNNVQITAANISISDLWNEDANYLIPVGESIDQDWINNLKNALDSDGHDFTANGEVFSGTFKEFMLDYTDIVAEDYAFYEGRYEASVSVLSSVYDLRDSISGVNLDEETANMMLYNKSYQAAARLMTALDEALDTLINKTGIVGR